MASQPAVLLSLYGHSLEKARQCYEVKVVECGGIDPLLLTDDETSLLSLSGQLVPRVPVGSCKDQN